MNIGEDLLSSSAETDCYKVTHKTFNEYKENYSIYWR